MKYRGNVPSSEDWKSYGIIKDEDGTSWMVFFNHKSNAFYISIKLARTTASESKANYWLGYVKAEKRFTNSHDLEIVKSHPTLFSGLEERLRLYMEEQDL